MCREKKKTINFFAAAVCFAGIVATGITLAQSSMKSESRANIFEIGEASIDLVEENWNDDIPEVLPDKTIPKDPKIVNIGDTMLYVYLEVKIPKKTIKIVDDEGKTGEASLQQLFTYDYHMSGMNGLSSGWILMESHSSYAEYNHYLYGYSDVLEPGQETCTLFDQVHFINMIHGEIASGTKLTIPITAYAIQAQYLGEEASTAEGRLRNAWNLYQAEE